MSIHNENIWHWNQTELMTNILIKESLETDSPPNKSKAPRTNAGNIWLMNKFYKWKADLSKNWLAVKRFMPLLFLISW